MLTGTCSACADSNEEDCKEGTKTDYNKSNNCQFDEDSNHVEEEEDVDCVTPTTLNIFLPVNENIKMEASICEVEDKLKEDKYCSFSS